MCTQFSSKMLDTSKDFVPMNFTYATEMFYIFRYNAFIYVINLCTQGPSPLLS